MDNFQFTAPVNSWDNDDWEKKDFGNKIALIDADRYKHLVTYRMYQKLMDEGFDMRSKEMIDELIESYLRVDIFNQFQCKDYIFCFSAPSSKTFRHAFAQHKEYKGNRKGKVDPNFYEGKYEDMAYVFEYINKRYHTLFFDDLEADDLLSMLQDEDDTFIFSHDKDLKQVVGWHYNMERRGLDYTDEELGMQRLLDQILIGDTTDNITGLIGFGEKGLEKFKEECAHMDKEQVLWLTVKKYINKYGLLHGIDTFVEMWGLVSMKIDRGDWFKEKYSKAFSLLENIKNT